jgi:hypothetical protein
MVVVPSLFDVASPFKPAVLLIVATPVLVELQATDDVRSCTVVSENVPIAVNCLVLPRAMLVFVGVTTKALSVAAVTESVAELDVTPVKDDVMLAPPTLTAVALPCEPAALLMVATPELDVAQVATVVKIWVVVSASLPVAVNCCVVPLGMLGAVGVTPIDSRAEDVKVAVPETPE